MITLHCFALRAIIIQGGPEKNATHLSIYLTDVIDNNYITDLYSIGLDHSSSINLTPCLLIMGNNLERYGYFCKTMSFSQLAIVQT